MDQSHMALLRSPEETKRDEHRWAQLMKYREGFRSRLGRSWCEIKAEKHRDRTGRTWMATYSGNTSTKSTKIHILGERRRLFSFRRCQPTSIHKELRKWQKVLGAILIWEGAIHFWDLVGIVNKVLGPVLRQRGNPCSQSSHRVSEARNLEAFLHPIQGQS